MARAAEITGTRKYIETSGTPELGPELGRISEKITASGKKPLTQRELERELVQRCGGIH